MSKKNKNLRLVDAPLYNYWQAIYLSFFSPQLYIDVVKRWRGFNFLYLLFVISLATIPFSLRVIHGFDRYFNEEIIFPLSKLPLLYVQNGNISFDEAMPYFIKNKKGEVIDIIDTTGKVNDITSAHPNLILLITKDKIYSRYPKLNLFFESTDRSNEGEVSVQTLGKSMNELFIEFMIYPVVTLFLYGMYLVIMVVFGYTAIIFAQVVLKYKLKFKDGIRLFIVTATPQIILFYIIFTTNYQSRWAGLVQIILMAIYFNYAVLCLKHEGKKMVRT